MTTPLHTLAAPPAGTRTDRVLLRPLRATDVDRDYDAVMVSREQLRRWGQTTWPADNFTLEENLDDLVRHERDHEERVSFTFTVFNPADTRCLGCVYLVRPAPAVAGRIGPATDPIQVSFWARSDELTSDLDAHILGTLRDWFAREWWFDAVAFTVSVQDTRQRALLEGAGLRDVGPCAISGGRDVHVFVERIERAAQSAAPPPRES